ncbi:MAG: copper amine oxidase N-terminal domain-containing protein [Candidatus Eremiobacteraeota bacterium]|nr:copper amine oxidase N-terminal domain-containing protein [Candidatus Eremiobacteraeota bacterium]MBV8283799.1 copper amine oxidase N-terminal domain-containing protein [Candidatus Eremiobacteraeota bacterium]MBV8655443.1 copper amine oxidase N-terminal domain-containing protein [Candidatus Eremiobacteraeota bacterium]
MTYRAPSWRTTCLTAVVATMVSGLLAFSRPAIMMVDGQRIDSDVPPVTTTSDKVFVPIRSIADALGAETQVDEQTGRIDVIRGNQSLRLRVGDVHATLNGMPLTMKHPPFRVRGRVMISLKTVATAFGVRVGYDRRTERIDVLTPGVGQAIAPSGTEQTQ